MHKERFKHAFLMRVTECHRLTHLDAFLLVGHFFSQNCPFILVRQSDRNSPCYATLTQIIDRIVLNILGINVYSF